MKCDEMAEYVSAMGDGEVVPREAAEHVRECAACRERLREYAAMGVELRVMAGLSMEDGMRARDWASQKGNGFKNLWSKGWETMRIPRLAFVMLVVAVVGLASAFAVVQVRARGEGSVVLLKLTRADGTSSTCPLSLVDKKQQSCGSLGPMGGRMVGYSIDLIGRKGEGVELAVRTKNYGPSDGSYSSTDIDTEPKRKMYVEPGQTVKLDVSGVATLALTGEWLDHMPVTIGASGQDVQAGPEELRVLEPLLISDKSVLGAMEGGSAIVDKAGEAIGIYIPKEGHFTLSLSPMKGAVEAKVVMNRISFEAGGRAYEFVTASPVCRSEHVWVVHQPESRTDDGEHAGIGAGELKQMAPELVE